MTSSAATLAEKINCEIVDHLYNKFHEVIIADSFGAIVYTVILWSVINHHILLIWLISELIINGLGRHILTFSFFKAETRPDKKLHFMA